MLWHELRLVIDQIHSQLAFWLLGVGGLLVSVAPISGHDAA